MEVEDSKKLDGKLMGRAAGRGFTKPAGEMVDGLEFFKPTKGENMEEMRSFGWRSTNGQTRR